MATNRQTILTRNRHDLSKPYRLRLDTPMLNQDTLVRRQLDERVTAFGVKEDAILNNRGLSDSGKQEQLAALAIDSLGSFAFLRRVVDDVEGEATGIRATMFAVKPPLSWGTDILLNYWRGKEIRDQFRGLPQPELDSRFLQAAEADHEGTLWALLNAPDDEPMVSEEIQRRALAERAKRQNPAAFHRLEQLDLVAEELGGLRDHVVIWLRSLSGDQQKIYDALGGPEPEPTTAQAGQMVAA